jgi:hypothetical protein
VLGYVGLGGGIDVAGYHDQHWDEDEK